MKYHKGKAEQQFIYIAKPGKKLLGVLNGVNYSSVSLTKNANNTYELTFNVHRYIDGQETAFYEHIDELMNLYVDGIWFLINEPPVIDNDGWQETKTVVAESLEIELQNYDLQNFLVGQGIDGSYEFKYYKEHEEQYQDGSFPSITFCNKENPRLSLLHLALYHSGVIPVGVDENGKVEDWTKNINKATWKIGEIDQEIRTKYNGDGTALEKETKLEEDKYAFAIDNQDLYSFLTQEVSGAFSCVFVFDTVNCTINAYYVEHVGKDTNVFIGWRNIQNSLEATRNDQLYTSLSVGGGTGLQLLTYANFGESIIEDYSYFMNEKYVNSELIAKYYKWLEYRDSLKDSYGEATRDFRKNQDIAYEINYRLPLDGVSNDWDSMSLEDLESAHNDYTALIRGYDEYKDELNESDKNHYYEIKNYILPAIENAISKKTSETGDTVEIQGIIGNQNLIANAYFGSTENWENINSNGNITISEDSSAGVTGATASLFISQKRKYEIETTIVEVPELDADGNQTYYEDGSPITTTQTTTELISDGVFGIRQRNLVVTKGKMYTLSVYAKSTTSSILRLEIGRINTSDETNDVLSTNYTLSNGWRQYTYKFNAPADKIYISFWSGGENENGGNFTLTAPKLEGGSTATKFNYYVQDDDTIKAWEKNWDLYGVKELEILVEKYRLLLDVLNDFQTDYNEDDTYFSEDEYNIKRQLYKEYSSLYNGASSALSERKKEYEKYENLMNQAKDKQTEIKNKSTRSGFSKQNPSYAFTDADEATFIRLYKHTDYTNENVVVTSIMTSDQEVAQHELLLENATEELYAVSHPQYSWTDTLDNILSMEEFKYITYPLGVYDFVHVEVEEGLFENLRIISMVYNPCIYDGEFTITFSSITRYKSKRNDYQVLLSNAAVKAAKNALSMSLGNSTEIDGITITPDLIRAILNNGAFKSYVGQNGSGTINADMVITKILKADEATIGKLTAKIVDTNKLIADQAFIDALSSRVQVSQSINVSQLTGDFGAFSQIIAQNITFSNISGGTIRLADGMQIVNGKDNEESTLVIDGTGITIGQDGGKIIELGFEGNGEPALILRGSGGEEDAILLDTEGLHQGAIKDGLIVNRMIGKNTITGDKIDWSTTGAQVDGNGNVIWNASSFTMDDKSLDIIFTEIETEIENVKVNLSYRLNIYTSNGVILDRTNPSTTLSALLFYGSDDVTTENENYLFWSRSSNDKAADDIWNEAHKNPSRSIVITRSDIKNNAMFTCKFIKNNTVMAQSEL